MTKLSAMLYRNSTSVPLPLWKSRSLRSYSNGTNSLPNPEWVTQPLNTIRESFFPESYVKSSYSQGKTDQEQETTVCNGWSRYGDHTDCIRDYCVGPRLRRCQHGAFRHSKGKSCNKQW